MPTRCRGSCNCPPRYQAGLSGGQEGGRHTEDLVYQAASLIPYICSDAPYTNNIDRPEQDRTGQVTKGQA